MNTADELGHTSIGRSESAPDGCLPLPTLLSQALVAFTIEFDNEFERQMPHRTTNHGSTAGPGYGPWLVSLVMWSNCMRFIGEEGVRVGELERLAGTPTNLAGMQRWGYIVVKLDQADSRPKPPPSDWVIRATPAGRKAQAVWQPLFGTIEQRWQERFGKDKFNQLRETLWALIGQLDVELPDCMPILGYGLVTKVPHMQRQTAAAERADSDLALSALLSKVLLAFALDFERESEVSLAISANVLRIVSEKGTRVRDLPRLAGVSKEAISMAVSFLEKRGYALVESESPGSRVKVLVLTAKGWHAQDIYRQLVWTLEQRWASRFGGHVVERLRAVLEQVVGGAAAESPLLGGLEPYPDGWRASVPRPETLPHYPMVLHRGGFPDGS